MKHLCVLLMFISSAHALAAEVLIGRMDGVQRPHRCQVASIEVETRYANQPNRVVLSLRDSRDHTLITCPASVAVVVDSRGEAIKLFEILRTAKQSTCLIDGAVTSPNNRLTCERGFNVKVDL